MNGNIVLMTKEEMEEMMCRMANIVLDGREKEAREPTPELMTKSGVARYMLCDVQKIGRYVARAIDPLPYEMFGDHPRYRKEDIDQWLKRQKK